MQYGRLNERQAKIVKRFVAGKVVTDFGAGNMGLSRTLLRLGATRVIAVDQTYTTNSITGGILWCCPDQSIEMVASAFRSFKRKKPPDVAFVSWPENYHQDEGLVGVVKDAGILIYLGKNTDGQACGSPAFFRHQLRRPLLAHAKDPCNTLIVTGPLNGIERRPTLEERSGITMYDDRSRVIRYR